MISHDEFQASEKIFLPLGLVLFPPGIVMFIYVFFRDVHRGLHPSVLILLIPVLISAALFYCFFRLKLVYGWFGGDKK